MTAISLDIVKAHLRVDGTDEDELIGSLIDQAAGLISDLTGALFEQQEVEQDFDGFGVLRLRAWPIADSPAPALSFVDPTGAPQAFTLIRVAADAQRIRSVILPALGAAWPRAAVVGGAVTVTYTAGFAQPTDVPQAMRRAMLLMIGHYYANREAVMVGTSAAAAEIPMGVQLHLRRYIRKVC